MNKYTIIDKYAYQFDIKRRLEHANNRVKNKRRKELSDSEKKDFNKNWGGVEISKLRILQSVWSGFQFANCTQRLL